MAPVLGLVGCAAGGLEQLVPNLIEPIRRRGWRIAVTLTPTAATWLEATGDIDKIEDVTGFPVRHEPRLPWQDSPHPPVDCYAVVPATANTVAKLALGIADNQAVTQVCEAIGLGEVPIVVFPRINAAHSNQPAWSDHVAALRRAGVQLVMGEDIWPLHRPRSAPGRELPWASIIDAIVTAVPPAV
jgi:flavoprotein